MSEESASNSNPDTPESSGEIPPDLPPADTDSPTLPDESLADSQDAGDEKICPTCGAEIPPDAPRGLCPKCALAGAAVPTDADSRGGRSRSGPRFEPPELETVAAAFPQLEIVELIGCGGMGAVYKARQPHLDRFVALKILPPSLAETPGFTERFSREGRLLAKLSHPAIVGVHDFGQAGGFFFLLMEYVDGVNLRQAMRAGRFTPEQALEIVPKVCEALQFAHDEGVLHRDIKPENILLDSRGVVKIADFGIAKLLDEAAELDPTLTGSMAPGTPHYMAPEQIEEPAGVDHRADIYSLGVVFYEMLTGELPIGRFAAPSEKSAVDPEIDEIVFRSLEKERDRRQQSAAEVKTEIEGVPASTIGAERHPGYAIPAQSQSVEAVRPSGGKRAATLVLIATLLPLLLNVAALIGYAVQYRVQLEQMAQAEQARNIARAEASQTEKELEQLRESLALIADGDDRIKFQRAISEREKELQELLIKAREPQQHAAQLRTSFALIWAPMGSLALLALMVLAVGIPGTVMGWKSLRRIRALELPESRVPSLFAALFLPLLAMGVLVLALIGGPACLGPAWMAALGLSLSVIVSIGLSIWIVRKTWTWSKAAPDESERRSVLADFERADPWPRRLLWLVLGLFGAMMLLLGSGWLVARGGFRGAIPSVVEVLIILGVIGLLVFLFRLLLKSSSRSAKASHRNTDVNPWPKRVFWLIVLIVVLPVLFLGGVAVIGMLVALLSYQGAEMRPESHSVQVISTVEQEHAMTVELESRRFGGENVNFSITYEGPQMDETADEDHDSLFPGQGIEWNLFGDERRRHTAVTFRFPDRETAALASREIMRAGERRVSDARRVELFSVMSGKTGPWRAWIEMRPGTVVGADSPPVEELLVGSWRMDTGVPDADEIEIADIVLTFSADRVWSSRARFMAAETISSGIWKLRGGGRLALETYKSSTASDVGKIEHATIETIDESRLVIRGQVEDDPEELITYRRIADEIPASPE